MTPIQVQPKTLTRRQQTPLIEIWCDGSAHNTHPEAGGGWGAVYYSEDGGDLERSGYIAPPCKTGRAELIAIIESVKALGDGPHNLKIYTDSEYAIKAGEQRVRVVMHNEDEVHELRTLARTNWIEYAHVRGHGGDTDESSARNERAHELANLARTGGAK